jgi:hypothetical protein
MAHEDPGGAIKRRTRSVQRGQHAAEAQALALAAIASALNQPARVVENLQKA